MCEKQERSLSPQVEILNNQKIHHDGQSLAKHFYYILYSFAYEREGGLFCFDATTNILRCHVLLLLHYPKTIPPFFLAFNFVKEHKYYYYDSVQFQLITRSSSLLLPALIILFLWSLILVMAVFSFYRDGKESACHASCWTGHFLIQCTCTLLGRLKYCIMR